MPGRWRVGQPAGVAGALAMLDRALGALAAADAASLPAGVQADVLRAPERAQSRQVAVRAQVLSAFMARGGCTADGQGTGRLRLTAHALTHLRHVTCA